MLCGEQGRSRDFWNGPNHYRPKRVVGVYRGYWKTHPLRMAIVIGLQLWIEMLLNKRVVVRVQPDEPNPLEGLSDPAT